jgi:hypothetical protein
VDGNVGVECGLDSYQITPTHESNNHMSAITRTANST